MQFILSALLCTLAIGQSVLTAFRFDEDFASQTGARALDGTPAMYFYGQGQDDKIIIFLEGGGYCKGYDESVTGEDNCDDRKKEGLGSTKYITANETTIDCLDSAAWDGWHKVYVPYISGDLWSGRMKTPDSHSSYFSGSYIIEGVLLHLWQNQPVQGVKELVLSGGSAGGAGAISQLATVKNYVNNDDVRVTGMAYSGWFPGKGFHDYDGSQQFIEDSANAYKIWSNNAQSNSATYQSCISAESDPRFCMASDVLWQYVSQPFFAVEESFDTEAIWVTHKDSPRLLKGLKYAEQYVSQSEEAIQTLPNRNGYFMLSCVGHCFSAGFKMEELSIGSQTLSDAWTSWYSGDSVRVIEKCERKWPPCNEYYWKGQCGWPRSTEDNYTLF